MELEVLNSADLTQHQKWIEIWDSWEGHEVYAHPNYANLYRTDNEETIAFYMKTTKGGILFPLIKRALLLEDWVSTDVKLYDVIWLWWRIRLGRWF